MYLGVSISSKMSWSDHIDDICAKTKRSFDFICRHYCNCPQYIQYLAYALLIHPILEYACCVLDPYQRKHIEKLESVQRHAAQFTSGNCHSMNPGCVTNMVTQLGCDLLEHRRAKHRMNPGCVTNMVTQLGCDLLEHRRAIHRITMFYEIINNLVYIPVHHGFKVHGSSVHRSAAHKIRQFSTKLNCNKSLFLPASVVLCNTLPLEVRQLTSPI